MELLTLAPLPLLYFCLVLRCAVDIMSSCLLMYLFWQRHLGDVIQSLASTCGNRAATLAARHDVCFDISWHAHQVFFWKDILPHDIFCVYGHSSGSVIDWYMPVCRLMRK